MANRKLLPQYRDTDGVLQPIYGYVDTTGGEEDGFRLPLIGDGRISWHRSTFTGWTATTLDSVNAYWIALDVTAAVPQAGESVGQSVSTLAPGGNLAMDSPGPRAFLLEPVNAIIPTKLRGATRTIAICADRRRARSQTEPGGNLGILRAARDETETVFIAEQEGSGVLGQVTKPGWTQPGTTDTYGTSGGVMTKNDQSFSWQTDQWLGAQVASGTAGASSTSAFVAEVISAYPSLEHHRLEDSTVGLTAEVYKTTAAGYFLFPALGAASGDTYLVRRHPFMVRTLESEGRFYEIIDSGAHTVTLDSTGDGLAANPNGSNSDANRYCNWEIGRFAPYALSPSGSWTGAYEPLTGKLLLTNGRNGILEFDGTRTRRLAATWDPTDGVPGASRVLHATGEDTDALKKLGIEGLTTSFLLRQPPNGRFIAVFKGHIVVASLNERQDEIRFSRPHGDNDIWPSRYVTRISDSTNNPIVGMWPLGDRLVVGTRASLHWASAPDNEGRLTFDPIFRGASFVTQHAVVSATIPALGSGLVGVTADGVSVMIGGAMAQLLDDWSKVVPGGVNTNALDKASATVWAQEGIIFYAVPSAGSTVPDRIVAHDIFAGKFWLWSAPWGGVTAMATELDSSGRERVMFGHVDGHVSVLADGVDDSGEEIVNRARSAPLSFENRTVALTALHIHSAELGPTDSFTIKTRMNHRGSVLQEGTIVVDAGGARFEQTLYNATRYAQEQFKTVKLPLRAAGLDAAGSQTQGHVGEAFDFELSGLPSRARFRGGTITFSEKGIRAK